nr:hypothetical protein CFP56_57112 [Quercus suber]
MVIFYDSSRTLNDQSVTLLRSTNEPPEKGVVLKVHPLGSSVPSSSSTTIPRPPSLSQWWVESSHELHDPNRKDSHVTSRTFTLASNLHSTADHVHPFPFLSRRISAREVQWALPSSKTPPLQYRGSRSKAVPRMFRYSEEGAAKHYDEVTARRLFRAVTSFKFHRLGLFKGHREILFLIPACPSEHGAPCTKDYMNWWARRFDGFFSSRAEQPIGNVNPSKIRLKIKQPNEVVEPVKRRSDGKPSFGISEATDESLGGACVDKVHSPKRGPSCIVSTPQDVEVTKGKDASDSERNSGNSDSH